MPGQQLQTTAFILAKQLSGSDTFEQLTAYAGEHGTLLCLLRTAKKTSTSGSLDLFDETELALESSNQGRTWFIKEHRLVQRHDGIGRSYATLRAASLLATLISRNAVPEESRASIMTLLRTSLGALANGGRPDITWLKTLYCFLRDEGYPVKQQWWPDLPAADRELVAHLLNQPLAAQTADAATVNRLTVRLQTWVSTETEIRL
jgi:hypothetical protein